MANDLQALMAQNLAGGLEVLRPAFTMLRAMNYVYDPIPGGVNSNVEIYNTVRGSTYDVSPANVPPASIDTNTKKQLITCDRWKGDHFVLTDSELATLSPERIALIASQKVADLAELINADVVSNVYKSLYNTVGAIGSPTFGVGVDVAVDAQRKLNDNFVSGADRTGILSTLSYANALKLVAFQHQYASGSPEVQREGMLGRRFGIDWMYDQQVVGHVAGAASGYLTNGITAIGSNVTAINTGTGTFNVGDVFTIAGNTQQYVVRAGTTTTSLVYSPSNPASIASGSAITKIASHNIDMVLQKACAAFVTRPLTTADTLSNQLGKNAMTMNDPESGLSLRHVVSTEYNQTRFEFQILYGYSVVRPECGVRIIS